MYGKPDTMSDVCHKKPTENQEESRELTSLQQSDMLRQLADCRNVLQAEIYNKQNEIDGTRRQLRDQLQNLKTMRRQQKFEVKRARHSIQLVKVVQRETKQAEKRQTSPR